MTNDEKLALLDEKLEELKADQEKDLLLDFDNAIKEKQAKPLTIKFQDEIFEIPASMPFNFSTFFFRYCYKKLNGKIKIEVPEDRMIQFIELMFGKKFVTALERSTITVDMVFDTLASTILDKWGYSINKKSDDMEKKML
jgi:hypothetical protein